MDDDAASQSQDGSRFDDPSFFRDNFDDFIHNSNESSFLPDGMSELFDNSSVTDSQARAPESSVGRAMTEVEMPAEKPASEAAGAARESATDDARAEHAHDAAETLPDADPAGEAPAEQQSAQGTETEQAEDPHPEQGADVPVESIERAETGGDTEMGGNANTSNENGELPQGRSSSQASGAMMPPPRPRVDSHAPATLPASPEDSAPVEKNNISPRTLNLGNSMLGRKKDKAPRASPARASPALSISERLKARQHQNRTQHQNEPEDVRQSIEPADEEQDIVMLDASDTEITNSKAFHRYEARSFAIERPVLRYKAKVGSLSEDEQRAWDEMEAKQQDRLGLISPRHERTPSTDREFSPAEGGPDGIAAAFNEVKALRNRRKKANMLNTEEEIEFMKLEAQEKARLRKQQADAMYTRTPSVASEERRQPARSETPMFVPSRSTPTIRPPREPATSSRRSNFQQPASKRPRVRERAASEIPRSRASSAVPPRRQSNNTGSRQRTAREASVSLDINGRTGNFTWKTPRNRARGAFARNDKVSQQEFDDAEMDRLIRRARQQADDAEGRRDQLHIDDGFGPDISFGDYFLEACKNEDRNGVPEGYLENCVEMLANIIRKERPTPQYRGVPLKERLAKARDVWKRPMKKDPETGRLVVSKTGVDKEFDKRKNFIFGKIRSAQISVEHACRFAIECDIQRCRLQRRHLQHHERGRTQAHVNDEDGTTTFRLPNSSQFKEARKPNMDSMIEEASQMLAEALFHVGAASHRILNSFSGDESQVPRAARSFAGAAPFAPIGESPIGGYPQEIASDTDGIEVESENGDLFD